MRNYWLISDTHFFHANSLNWGFRNFSCVDHMNETMIENWNECVKPGDYVYHLGDVWMGPSTHEERAKLWSRLTGSKRLIVGNHDDIPYLSKGGFFKKVQMWKHWNDFPFLLTHVPVHESSLYERIPGIQPINIHGHTHANGSPKGPYHSVCVEMTNYKPVNLEELRDMYK